MKIKKSDERQQQLLESFYKEFLTWSTTDLGYRLIVGLYSFIIGILMLIPFEEADRILHLIPMMSIFSYSFYLCRFTTLTEQGKQSSLYKKLKYLPISQRQFKLYYLRRYFKFLLRLLPVYIGIHLFSAAVFSHHITPADIFYPVLSTLGSSLVPAALTYLFNFDKR